MAGKPAAGARGLGFANFSNPARISILPKNIGIISYRCDTIAVNGLLHSINSVILPRHMQVLTKSYMNQNIKQKDSDEGKAIEKQLIILNCIIWILQYGLIIPHF